LDGQDGIIEVTLFEVQAMKVSWLGDPTMKWTKEGNLEDIEKRADFGLDNYGNGLAPPYDKPNPKCCRKPRGGEGPAEDLTAMASNKNLPKVQQ